MPPLLSFLLVQRTCGGFWLCREIASADALKCFRAAAETETHCHFNKWVDDASDNPQLPVLLIRIYIFIFTHEERFLHCSGLWLQKARQWQQKGREGKALWNSCWAMQSMNVKCSAPWRIFWSKNTLQLMHPTEQIIMALLLCFQFQERRGHFIPCSGAVVCIRLVRSDSTFQKKRG